MSVFRCRPLFQVFLTRITSYLGGQMNQTAFLCLLVLASQMQRRIVQSHYNRLTEDVAAKSAVTL